MKCPHRGSENVIRAGKLRNKYVVKQGRKNIKLYKIAQRAGHSRSYEGHVTMTDSKNR